MRSLIAKRFQLQSNCNCEVFWEPGRALENSTKYEPCAILLSNYRNNDMSADYILYKCCFETPRHNECTYVPSQPAGLPTVSLSLKVAQGSTQSAAQWMLKLYTQS
jgi:hypothetical protein